MTKVWVVSGFVLMGTGLALAAFGGWMTGNANCDAADLGRSCLAASLGVAVIGAALAGAGWMQVRRLNEGNGSGRAEFLTSRPGLLLLVLIVVGLILLAALVPFGRLPVNVFAKPAPSATALPQDLLPDPIAGLDQTSLEVSERNGSVEALGNYSGGVQVRITRYNATNATMVNATPATIANAEEQAASDLDRRYAALDPAVGARQCVKGPSRHWFTQGGATSAFAWRAGTFVFEVRAPTEELRDRVAAALSA